MVRFRSNFGYSHESGLLLFFAYRGDSSMVSGLGRTGGESDHLVVVALRDALGEPPFPLGKARIKLIRLNTLWGLNI